MDAKILLRKGAKITYAATGHKPKARGNGKKLIESQETKCHQKHFGERCKHKRHRLSIDRIKLSAKNLKETIPATPLYTNENFIDAILAFV